MSVIRKSKKATIMADAGIMILGKYTFFMMFELAIILSLDVLIPAENNPQKRSPEYANRG